MPKVIRKMVNWILISSIVVPTWFVASLTSIIKVEAATAKVTVNSKVTNDSSPKIIGTVEDNPSEFVVYINGYGYSAASGDVVILGSSSPYDWELQNNTISPALTDGIYNVTATAKIAGDYYSDVTSDELTIDTIIPAVPVFTVTNPVNSLNQTEVIIAGFGEPLAILNGDINDGSHWQTITGTVMPDGTFSIIGLDLSLFDDSSPSNIPSIFTNITQEDIAGNISPLGYYSSIKDTTSPDDPANLRYLLPLGNNVNLSWDASVAVDLAGYNVYRYSSPAVKLNSYLITATNFSDILTVSGLYHYYITAVDNAGNESIESNIVDVVFNTAPVAPVVTANAGVGKNIVVNFNGVGHGVASYLISINGVTQVPANVAGDDLGKAYSFTIPVLEYGTYHVTVTANGPWGVLKSSESIVTLTAPVAVKTVVLATVFVTPASNQEVTPVPVTQQVTPVPTPSDQGKIKGDETEDQSDEPFNWTPWIILFIIIVLAGAATGGYYYWLKEEPESEVTVKESTKKNQSKVKPVAKKNNSKKSNRW